MTTGRAVIFDIDGVLIDSYAAHRESWQQLAREQGVEFTDEQFDAGFGRTSRDIIRMVWPAPTPDDATVTRLDDMKEAAFRRIVSADFPAMPGAAELIDDLVGNGFVLAAGSSGPPENVSAALAGLERRDRFSSVVTGADVERGKPDPQVFLLAAERLGMPPSSCCVIEDAPAGIEAARRAGMTCVGLASTGRSPDQLAGADLVVERLHELTAERIIALSASLGA